MSEFQTEFPSQLQQSRIPTRNPLQDRASSINDTFFTEQLQLSTGSSHLSRLTNGSFNSKSIFPSAMLSKSLPPISTSQLQSSFLSFNLSPFSISPTSLHMMTHLVQSPEASSPSPVIASSKMDIGTSTEHSALHLAENHTNMASVNPSLVLRSSSAPPSPSPSPSQSLSTPLSLLSYEDVSFEEDKSTGSAEIDEYTTSNGNLTFLYDATDLLTSSPPTPVQKSITPSTTSALRPKRSQVKNACIHCQKACKKCDDSRPCSRCVKYKLAGSCRDSSRKERKKNSQALHPASSSTSKKQSARPLSMAAINTRHTTRRAAELEASLLPLPNTPNAISTAASSLEIDNVTLQAAQKFLCMVHMLDDRSTQFTSYSIDSMMQPSTSIEQYKKSCPKFNTFMQMCSAVAKEQHRCVNDSGSVQRSNAFTNSVWNSLMDSRRRLDGIKLNIEDEYLRMDKQSSDTVVVQQHDYNGLRESMPTPPVTPFDPIFSSCAKADVC